MPLVHLQLATLLSLTFAISTVLDICAKEIIPPTEAGSIVTDESLVMVVMVVSASPEGNPIAERPREIVAGMSIDRLEKSQHNPQQHGDQMKTPSIV